MRSPPTLDKLWSTLGLDSLPADAGTAADLNATRARDWQAETVKNPRSESNPRTERQDLPRISIAPPALDNDPETADPRKDLAVIGLLGEGGMGRVLLARQSSLDRDVAVKVTHGKASGGAVQALVHEARITGGLEHPGIVPVYALASDVDGQPALVMKRVDGVPWSALVQDANDRGWPRIAAPGEDHLDTHVRILQQVCNAIAFAHRRGIIHRDLKPANVLIGEFGEVYVADWGVATKKPLPGEVRKPCLVGTPVYLAPEMLEGDDAQMDERTDIFLLGAILYEVLSGHPPWRGPDLRHVLEVALECKPPALPATAPPELALICERAMARAPDDRYPDALSLRDALTGYLRHRGSMQLTRATVERLDALTALLATGSKDRAEIGPLMTECRFGFRQALREWPRNKAAQDGLDRALLTMARFEVGQGNLDAAREIARELTAIPEDLQSDLQRLEVSASTRRRRDERLQHLSAELDPRVALRQRVAFMAAIGISSAMITISHTMFPSVREALTSLGPWYLVFLMTVSNTVYFTGLWLGRRSLLGTRLNRRVAGLLGACAMGPLFNRLLAVHTGAHDHQVLVSDMAITAVVAFVGGMTLHYGFFFGAAAFVIGATVSAVFANTTTTASIIYSITAVVGISAVAFSWRRWRNELWVPEK